MEFTQFENHAFKIYAMSSRGQWVKSLAPGRYTCNIKLEIFKLILRINLPRTFPVKLPSGECPKSSLVISQHWLRWWLGAIRQLTWLSHCLKQCGPRSLTPYKAWMFWCSKIIKNHRPKRYIEAEEECYLITYIVVSISLLYYCRVQCRPFIARFIIGNIL